MDNNEVWVLGGTGRSGRAIAAELLRRGITPVLVGRDAARLQDAAARLQDAAARLQDATARLEETAGATENGRTAVADTAVADTAAADTAIEGTVAADAAAAGTTMAGTAAARTMVARTVVAGTVVAGSVDAMADEIRRQRPFAVINTVGPFTATAAPIARACLPGSHYIDLANDVASVLGTLGLEGEATAAGRTVVTGSGFGVTATESAVVRLCQGRPAPARVRVDMVPSLAIEAGPIGEALAGTLVDGIPGVEGGGRYDGRRYVGGRLVRARVGDDVMRLVLPDGGRVTTAGMPLGELVAAQRASGAPSVVSASSELPTSPVARAMLPAATALLAIGPVREFARRGLARVRVKARPRPREYSWGHARAEWADGTVGESWLRVGDAQVFTGAVPAEVARRLLAGEGRPGAWTPATLFGPSLAAACGAEYLPGDASAVGECAIGGSYTDSSASAAGHASIAGDTETT
jgi:short subunit dehydrogenase-like uncharacterized protein